MQEQVQLEPKIKRQRQYHLSPSSMHMQTILEGSFNANNLHDNVESMITKSFPVASSDLSTIERSSLISGLSALIQNEINHHDDYQFFYHGCNNAIAFCYSVYTVLYRALHADDQWKTLRPDHEYLHRFLTISEFITEFQAHDTSLKVNNQKYYNDCFVATNVFAFGNFRSPNLFSIA
jgi:hypothetical protein